jgi:hypothetical protein
MTRGFDDNDWAKLRKDYIDGNEPAATGMQLVKPRGLQRGGVIGARMPRSIDFRDDAATKAFLDKQFPKYESCSSLRDGYTNCPCSSCIGLKTKALWTHVINTYFRGKMSARDAASGWNYLWCDQVSGRYSTRILTAKHVRTLAQRIRRAADGQRQDGKPRTGRPRGRPKKSATFVADKGLS